MPSAVQQRPEPSEITTQGPRAPRGRGLSTDFTSWRPGARACRSFFSSCPPFPLLCGRLPALCYVQHPVYQELPWRLGLLARGCEAPVPGGSGWAARGFPPCAGAWVYPRRVGVLGGPAGRRRSLLNRSSFFTCQGPLAVLRGGSVCVISCGLLFCCAMWALVAVCLFWKLLRVGNFRPSSCGSELRGAEPVVR